MTEVEKFSASAQVIICAAAALTLYSIWKAGYTPRTGRFRRDPGVGWLSTACALWSIMGIFQWLPANLATTNNRTVFSVLNSFFLLGAVVRLDVYVDAPPTSLGSGLRHLRTHAFWFWCAGVTILCVLLATASPERHLGPLVDVPLSVGTLLLLMFGFYKSFNDRGFKELAYVSVLVLALQLVGQLPELSGFIQIPQFAKDNQVWMLLTSKTMVCILFVALTYTWMHQKTIKLGEPDDKSEVEVSKPEPGVRPTLRILAPRSDSKERTVFVIEATRQVEGPIEVTLREGLFLRVLEVAIARIKGEDEGWKKSESWFGGNRKEGANVKNDFSDILAASHVDLVFDVDRPRGRRAAAAPEDIQIDVEGLLRKGIVFQNEFYWNTLRKELEALLKGKASPVEKDDSRSVESA